MRDFLHRLGRPWRESSPHFILFLAVFALGGLAAFLIGRFA